MVCLPATLTLAEARASATALGEQLRQEAAQGAPVLTLDATALLRFDSAALSVLLECQRVAAGLGKALSITGLAPRLLALATLYGIAPLITQA